MKRFNEDWNTPAIESTIEESSGKTQEMKIQVTALQKQLKGSLDKLIYKVGSNKTKLIYQEVKQIVDKLATEVDYDTMQN